MRTGTTHRTPSQHSCAIVRWGPVLAVVPMLLGVTPSTLALPALTAIALATGVAVTAHGHRGSGRRRRRASGGVETGLTADLLLLAGTAGLLIGSWRSTGLGGEPSAASLAVAGVLSAAAYLHHRAHH